MADFEPRMVNFRVLGMTILIVSVIFMVLCLAGLMLEGTPRGPWSLIFIISVLGGIVGLSAYGVIRLLLAIEANTHHAAEGISRLVKHLDRANEGIHALNENILLSDAAKAVAYRRKDRQALRQAIEEEMTGHDWEAALHMVDQMAQRFGYCHEAEEYRRQIEQARDRQRQAGVAAAMGKFEECLAAFEWEAAEQQIAAIQTQFPDLPEAGDLPRRLHEARVARKKTLLQQWDQAVQRNEVDRGIEVLKELDKYLTKNEVAAFEESARGVFRAKLHNLGVQFSLLVNEQQWDRALEVAEEIVKEFPNSRMAEEIGPGLPKLRLKATAMDTPTGPEAVTPVKGQ